LKQHFKDKFDGAVHKQQEFEAGLLDPVESDEDARQPEELPSHLQSDGDIAMLSSEFLMAPVETVTTPEFYSLLYRTDLATNIYPHVDVQDRVARGGLGKFVQLFRLMQFLGSQSALTTILMLGAF